jgi:hypothetical protein
MQNPYPINMMDQDEVRSLGWAAEARDKDGHLISTCAWLAQMSPHLRAVILAEFVTEYATDCTITVFPENMQP